MRGELRQANVHAESGQAAEETDAQNRAMSMEELREELAERERNMQRFNGEDGVLTDQWRVYSEIVEVLRTNSAPLRLFLQASAGTGKSYLLEAVYLWCVVNDHHAEACAPTGIAAARVRVPRTPVRAYTLHHLFALNVECESRIDPGKPGDEATERLARMTVCIVDEGSMVDDIAWPAMQDQLSAVAELRLAVAQGAPHPHAVDDPWGRAHILIAADLKQLPPATSRPPFLACDPELLVRFRFRVLRQNRRLATSSDPARQAELEDFHETLEEISKGRPTPRVRAQNRL